jgi:hypothetical protein
MTYLPAKDSLDGQAAKKATSYPYRPAKSISIALTPVSYEVLEVGTRLSP